MLIPLHKIKPNLPVSYAANGGHVPIGSSWNLPRTPDRELVGRPMRTTGNIIEHGPDSMVEVRGVCKGDRESETWWMRYDALEVVN